MRVVFVGVRKDIESITSGPQKVANYLYNTLKKSHDNIYFYGLYEDEVPDEKNAIKVINDREVKGPLYKLGSFIKENNIDVVYIARYYSKLALYSALLKKLHKVKIVYTVHGLIKKEHEINKSFKFYNLWIEGFLLRRADRIVAISGALKEELYKYYPEVDGKRITVINNGVALLPAKQEEDIRELYKLEKDRKVLFTVGTRRIKNIDKLLEAYTGNEALYASASLLVAGETDTEYAVEIIDKYKGFDNIRFIGYIAPDAMNNIYSQCDLYIQISEFETFGMSIVEALLHKKRVLIAAKLPIARYFDSSEAVFYDSDSDDLGELIHLSLEGTEEPNVKGYEKAASLFDWENISKEYYKTFEESFSL
jgi:glycosyltransferase involved in cell wall biosynthesis